MRILTLVRTVTPALALLFSSAESFAQSSPTADSTHRAPRAVFSKSDLALAAGFVVGAAATMPFDERVATWLQRPSLHQTTALHSTSTRIEDLALPGGYVAGYVLYGLGAVSANEPTLGAGFHTIGAVLVASHVGDAIKALAGRTRPSASADAEHYAFGAGFSNASQYSFPSGHTTVAFAAATAISEELSAHHQASVRVIAPMLYTGATLVGLSRMYNDAHWASDVVAGAAVGTFTARLLVREAYAHPGNIFDAAAVHAVMTVDQRGRALLGWSSGN